LILYIDDFFITSSDSEGIVSLKTALSNEFEMKGLGFMKKILGVEVIQTQQGILLHQTNYAQNILRDYTDHASHYTLLPELLQLRKDIGTPFTNEKEYQSLIGKLYYLTKIHPKLGFSASLASHFMHKPQLMHRHVVQHILNYLRCYFSEGLWFPRHGGTTLTGFSDADYNSNLDDRTSTSAYLFYFGTTLVSWNS
jgi:hypothetical protein